MLRIALFINCRNCNDTDFILWKKYPFEIDYEEKRLCNYYQQIDKGFIYDKYLSQEIISLQSIWVSLEVIFKDQSGARSADFPTYACYAFNVTLPKRNFLLFITLCHYLYFYWLGLISQLLCEDFSVFSSKRIKQNWVQLYCAYL